jgi:hypothetical protein
MIFASSIRAVFNGAQIYAIDKNALASGAASANFQLFSREPWPKEYLTQSAGNRSPVALSKRERRNRIFSKRSGLFRNSGQSNRGLGRYQYEFPFFEPECFAAKIIIDSEVYGQPPANEQPRVASTGRSSQEWFLRSIL